MAKEKLMMYPELFRIGDLVFYTHGVMAVLGIIIAAITLFLLTRRDLETTYLFDNITYSVLAGIIGARVLYFLLYPDQFSSFSKILFLWRGGLVSYGGFFVGALVFAFLLYRQKQALLLWFDRLALVFPLGLSIARFGEFAAGEDFGQVSSGILAVRGRFPLNLLEGAATILIFFLLIFLRARFKKPGAVTALSIALYACVRFILDFGRNESKIILDLSLGQMVSLVLFIFAALWFLAIIKRKGDYDGGIYRKTEKGAGVGKKTSA